MPATSSASVRGDRPLADGVEDKLGFRDVAARIALSLVDHASDDGLVVGIDGRWGSGKSSLLYLIEDELRSLPSQQRPIIINFRPWLVGNRDSLITNVFAELSKELDHVALSQGDASPLTITRAKQARETLRKFTEGLSRAGAAVEVVGDASGFAPIKWAGKGIKAVGDIAKGKRSPPQLTELKDKLTGSLRSLGQRFVVTIDDVDRLDPDEAVEVLRLARSVADLPNIVYLMCYDSEILSHNIERATGTKSGRDYLEKTVQLAVMVPSPEPFQLRQWFSDDLHEIASTKSEEELSRLKTVIDYEGGRRLRTPRAVVRAMDSIRFFWPPLREARADLADLVWLLLIKDGSPALYRWIESYCATAALTSLGTARVDDDERARDLSKLNEIAGEGFFADLMYRHYFAEQLPGVDVDFAQEGGAFRLYQKVSDAERDAAIRAARLASPDHYRLYFALSSPSFALPRESFVAMWSAAAASPQAVRQVLLDLHAESAVGPLSKADMMLERMRAGVHDVLSPIQCMNLLTGFSLSMDEAYRRRPFDRFWLSSL